MPLKREKKTNVDSTFNRPLYSSAEYVGGCAFLTAIA
jgi:hypothetical protein